MSQSDYASEQLHVIRSLMERATIYRAISAPMALIGGLLSLVGFGIAWYAQDVARSPLDSAQFLVLWIVILVLTAGSNIFFLWRESQQASGTFFSPGMRLALFSLCPAFVFAGVLTLLLNDPTGRALSWIISYGLALLATQHFAPRSLVVLGLAFFASGCAFLLFWKNFFPFDFGSSSLSASGLMAVTFGLYHLIYAASLWALAGQHGETHV